MKHRKSKNYPQLTVRLSDPDHEFIACIMEQSGMRKTDVIVGLIQIGRGLGPSSVLEAIRFSQTKDLDLGGRQR